MTDKVSKFRELFEEAIKKIAANTVPEKRCLILSGGVDTCAILTAADKLNVSFGAGITVVCQQPPKDGDTEPKYGPDELFARAAAEQFKHRLPHHYVIKVTAEDLVSTYLPPCVKSLHIFDGMTLRNSFVVAAAFQKASELGFTDVVVGDGADELMGGYSFMWANEDNPKAWKDKRDSMCRKWTFATETLANMYNLTSHGPYMDPPLVDWVLENVQR